MEELLSPNLQYGAFAICLALVGLLAWYLRFSAKMLNAQFRSLQEVQTETNHTLLRTQETIAHNSHVVSTMADRADQQISLLSEINTRLIERPCQLANEHNDGTSSQE